MQKTLSLSLCFLSLHCGAEQFTSQDLLLASARYSVLEYQIDPEKRARTLKLSGVDFDGEALDSVDFLELIDRHTERMDSIKKRDFLSDLLSHSGEKYTQVIPETQPQSLKELPVKFNDSCDYNPTNGIVQYDLSNVEVDLRSNGGGHLNCAISLANKLTRKKHQVVKVLTNKEDYEINVEGQSKSKMSGTVVVNSETASSAELLAWLLVQDGWTLKFDGISTETYGKNTTQNHFWEGGIHYSISVGEFRTNLCKHKGCKLSKIDTPQP